MHVIVLGAGLMGTTTAWFLAREGHDVTVVDRQGEVAGETSFANGSIIHVSLVEPWNAPGIASKLLQWFGREDVPFRLHASAVPGLLRWGAQFLRSSTPARHRQHTLTNLRLAMYSAALLKELRQGQALAYDHAELGLTMMFREQAELDHAAAFAAVLEPHGVPHRLMDRAALLAAEPALQPVAAKLGGALQFPDDETGDARMFTRAVADLARKEGVEIRFGTTVEAIDTDGRRVTGVHADGVNLQADRYVLALGSYSSQLARGAGLRLPVYPVKGYSLTVPLAGWNGAPRLPLVDASLKLGLIPLGDNRLRIAGSAEFAGYSPLPVASRADYLWRNALQVYPALATRADHSQRQVWAGLRPMTPDGPPILGATPLANLFLNTGHGHLGWTMAVGSARVVADLVCGRAPAIALDGLELARYS